MRTLQHSKVRDFMNQVVIRTQKRTNLVHRAGAAVRTVVKDLTKVRKGGCVERKGVAVASLEGGKDDACLLDVLLRRRHTVKAPHGVVNGNVANASEPQCSWQLNHLALGVRIVCKATVLAELTHTILLPIATRFRLALLLWVVLERADVAIRLARTIATSLPGETGILFAALIGIVHETTRIAKPTESTLHPSVARFRHEALLRIVLVVAVVATLTVALALPCKAGLLVAARLRIVLVVALLAKSTEAMLHPRITVIDLGALVRIVQKATLQPMPTATLFCPIEAVFLSLTGDGRHVVQL